MDYFIYFSINKYKLKMAAKLIKDIDDDAWRRFTGYCKIKGVKVGKELEKLLQEYLKNKIR